MICPQCGADSAKNINFCTECGSAPVTGTVTPTDHPGAMDGRGNGKSNLTGYSDRISDPAFARYRRHSTVWSFSFAAFLALAAVIGFYIYGETSAEMDNPEALYIGLGIGGMFLAIALFQFIGRSRSIAWDGVVIDKKTEKKRRRERSGNDERWISYTRYTVVIQTDSGKTYEINTDDDDTQYNYYRIGDKVRHHQGLNSLEKYDKTGDSIIFCNACSSLNDINDDRCHRCSCPLLK
ncbi:MAG: hypothetical protein ABRQ26_15120 [Syntrophomonadaceae bacterium]